MSSAGPGFAVLYRWRLHEGAEASFVKAWSRVSELLLSERGSLGSRLHRGADGWWYSYAQWPSAQAREQAFASGSVDPEASRQMTEAIAESLPELVLESVSDFMVMPPKKHIPAGRPSLIPRIAVDDPEGLVRFIQHVFGAGGHFQPERPSELWIGDSLLMIGSTLERESMPAFLYVYVEDADSTFQRALDSGAESIEKPQDMPYGDRRAMIRDPWGNVWQIATPSNLKRDAR